MLNIIVTNDDGINSPGLCALYDNLLAKRHEITVVAPSSQRSAASRSFTLHRSYGVRRISPHMTAVDGTPVDCVMLALQGHQRPDIILSGINHGANIGTDVEYSGTVGAAFEACLHKIPALSISLADIDPSPHFVNQCGALIGEWLEAGLGSFINPGVVVNVNFPAVSRVESAPIIVTELAPRGYYDNILAPSPDGALVEVTQHTSTEPFPPGTDGWGLSLGDITISVLIPQSHIHEYDRAVKEISQWVDQWMNRL